MTSQIVSDTIDENFPVAGQDNDSQGFRDNFNIIKDGLATANSEITDLQNNTAKTNEDNNFNGSLIDNAQTNRLYGTVYNIPNASGTITVDYASGEYQIINLINNGVLRFQNWPKRSDNVPVYAKMRVAILPSSIIPEEAPPYNIQFTTVNGSVISREGTSFPISKNPDEATVFDVWTSSDGTNDIYVSLVGNFDSNFNLSDLIDVSINNPTSNDYLRYVNGVWTNTSQGPSTTIQSLVDNIADVEAPDGLNQGDILVYNQASERWVNLTNSDQLGKLLDVSVADAVVGNVVRYTGVPDEPTSWRSETDPNIKFYQVSLPPNFDGDDGFFFNGTEIEPNLLTFHVGHIYRFFLNNPDSNSFNEQSGLRFSLNPEGTQPYTSNVTVVGSPGTVGSYVDIEITKDTPTPLYIYGGPGTAGSGPFPLGQNIPIAVIKDSFYTGSEQLAGGNTASSVLKTSYFRTSGPETSVLPEGTEGQIKVFAMREHSGNMVVTVSSPGWSVGTIGTITFDALGQACTLQYINGRWFCIGNNGATFA